MKQKYLYHTILGTILPNILVFKEMFATGNILLYTQPINTFIGMFPIINPVHLSLIYIFIVVLFLFRSFKESRKLQMKEIGYIWRYTFAFGFAGELSLYLKTKRE